jgi:hypothetical protein
MKILLVGLLLLGCGHEETTAPTTTDYLTVNTGRRAWSIQDPALVLALEERLSAQGYDPGPIDGVADDRTRQALHSFQQSRGLAATGILDRDTATALGLRWDRVRADVRAGRVQPL